MRLEGMGVRGRVLWLVAMGKYAQSDILSHKHSHAHSRLMAGFYY